MTDLLQFQVPLYNNYIVLNGGVLSVLMLSSVLTLFQVLSKRVEFGCVKGAVLSYSHI